MRHGPTFNGKLVVESFEKEGYKPLFKAEDYTNCHQKLYYLCPVGHKFYITRHRWLAGQRCPSCFHRRKADIQIKRSYGKLKKKCNDLGLILKTSEKEFRGYNHPVDVIHPCGHLGHPTLGNLIYGQTGCGICLHTNSEWKEKFDFNSPDAVRILTFLTYQGGADNKGRIIFTGEYLDYLLCLLKKYFFGVKYKYTIRRMFKSVVKCEYLIFFSKSFIKAFQVKGWRGATEESINVPDYILTDTNLFKVYLSAFIDIGSMFLMNNTNKNKGVFFEHTSQINIYDKINFYLSRNSLPRLCILKRNVEGKGYKKNIRYSAGWYSMENIYRILDFINWDLHRPWHIGVMDRLRRLRECEINGKRQFM